MREGFEHFTAVNEALKELEAAGVAKTLRECGVRGHPSSSGACPVARWLERETGHEVQVMARITLCMGDAEYRYAKNPKEVEDFVCGFDAGSYPDLEGV